MIGEGIEHRAAKVSLVNGLSTVLTLAFQLVAVPVCLKYWGTAAYGNWLALFAAFMMLRSLDGGFAAYVGNKLNYLYHQDVGALREHLSSAVAGVAVIGVLQIAIAAATMLYVPLAAALGVPPDHREGLSTQLGLLALIVSWALTGSYLGIVHRLQIPAGLMYQAAWWAMAFQITQFAAIMLAALLRMNMLHTSLLFAGVQIVIYAASAWYVRWKLPNFYPWLRGIDRRIGLRDLAQSLLLTGSNIVQQGATNGSVLLISFLAGPAAVAAFTTVRTLTNLWTSVTTVMTTPLLPEVVRLHVRGEVRKLALINEAFWILAGSAVNGGALLLNPLIPMLYGHWTAQVVVLDHRLLCLMLASVIVANSGALMALHLNGINSLGIVLAASITRAVLAIGVGALGFHAMGLASFGLGVLAGELAATLITGRHFMTYELAARGLHLPAAAFGPVILSTGSALVFFIWSGIGWSTGVWGWLLALSAVAAAAVWGWKTLAPDLRVRLKGVVTRYAVQT